MTPLLQPAYRSEGLVAEADRCINLYHESVPGGYQLIGRPGLGVNRTLATGPIRGMHWPSKGDETLLVVSGNRLYEDAAGAPVDRGTLSTSTGPVVMIDNGLVMLLLTGSTCYSFDFITSSFSVVGDAEFRIARTGCFLDGYFLTVPSDNTGDFQISALYMNLPGAGWVATDTAKAESSPDRLMTIVSFNRQAWLLGLRSTEVWFNSGNALFPFERVEGSAVPVGCLSAYGAVATGRAVYWIGTSRDGSAGIYRAAGYGMPDRISTPRIERYFANLSTVLLDLTVASVYEEAGHTFVLFSAASVDRTWVYDETTDCWSEWRSLDGGSQDRFLGHFHQFVGATHYWGGGGTIGRLFQSVHAAPVHQDDGQTITRQRAASHPQEGTSATLWREYETLVDTGGTVAAPTIDLDWSDDGGHTFSTAVSRSAGSLTEKQKRVTWRRLGRAYDRIYRLTYAQNTRCTILAADLTAEPLAS